MCPSNLLPEIYVVSTPRPHASQRHAMLNDKFSQNKNSKDEAKEESMAAFDKIEKKLVIARKRND